MKYTIEIIDGDCVETLEFPNGDQFTKKSERTYCGCRSLDDDFSEQLEQVAHRVQKDYDMIITGERRDEGGMRSVPRKDNTALCFTETASGQYRLRPLYYVSDKDKEWYKDRYHIRYSDAYEVYGLTRTGCCGCPISYKAVEDLEKIQKYEPNIVKAAWNIFGKSYEYRKKYNEYKKMRMDQEKYKAENVAGQMSLPLDEMMWK